MTTTSESQITAGEFWDVLRAGMPTAAAMPMDVVLLTRGFAILRLTTGPSDLRPGGTVAGPVLFSLADLALYAAVMSAIGVVPLAVTTDATIHFLRPAHAGVLVARASLLKEGKRLLVGDVTISHEGDDDGPVVHAVMTYSRPKKS